MGASERDRAASNQQAQAAWRYEQLSDLSLANLDTGLASILRDLNPDGTSRAVTGAFKTARETSTSDFNRALKTNDQLMRQQALQSGGVYSSGQVQSAIGQHAERMGEEFSDYQNMMKFNEAQAQMGQHNKLLNLMMGGSSMAVGLGQGAYGLQQGATGGLSGTNPWAGAAGGAMSGAAAGASAGWVGALVGALAGGALGYAGSR